jgi:RNA polymerase sigma-70 factor (ECF subfamily)
MTADLVRLARGGDHGAFENLIRAGYDRLFTTANRILHDRSAAEDAVQDAIVRCWRDLRGLRDPERFEAWLYRLLVNACRDQARRARRRPVEVHGQLPDWPALSDEYASLAERDALERAFVTLPTDQRIALVLTHYLGYSAPEVATILGIPTGTVYSRLHHGVHAMRAALAPPPGARTPTTEIPR